jgi:uncharacterized protein (UPF0303 family)
MKMSSKSDLEQVIAQERALVFKQFDENVAFAIGAHIRDAANAAGQGIAIEVRLWDRPLFYGATAGSSASNKHWIERKAYTVRMLMKSTYRVVLERGDKPRVFEENWGLDPRDYAIAGGGFPITVAGVGVVGAAIVSGVPERDDHGYVVAAICSVLGLDAAEFMLPAL